MMDGEDAMKAMATPEQPISFIPAKGGDIIHIGPIICRVLEDGSNTGTTPREWQNHEEPQGNNEI